MEKNIQRLEEAVHHAKKFEARFVDIANRELDEDSDLFAGGYRYPVTGKGGETE